MVYSFVAKLKSNGVGFDRAFFFVTAIRDEPGIMNYGSDLLILSAYAPSMPPLISLLLSMACDDSDGGAVKAVITRILAGQPFRLAAMAGLYSLTCIVPGISSHFNLNTAHAFAVAVSIATFSFTVMVTRMGYVAMMEYNYGLDPGISLAVEKFQNKPQALGIARKAAKLLLNNRILARFIALLLPFKASKENRHCMLLSNVLDAADRETQGQGVGQESANKAIGFIQEQKLQKKLTDVCEKERLYHELAYTTKNYDLDVDDKSEASFIMEVVDTIDCQLDLKQVSNPAYLTGIETYPQVSLLFHVTVKRKENICTTISSFKSLQAHVMILERKKLSP
ncbi:hypothetical protein Tco_0611719 [Tanacetum coccineum]